MCGSDSGWRHSRIWAPRLGYGPDVGIGGWDFFAWPIKNLFFCKPFGFDLIALLVTGIVAWKRLSTEQRVLFASTFLIWLWLGYGTMVPWTYRPLYRSFAYYWPLTLGIARCCHGLFAVRFAPGEARPRGCRRGHPRPLGMLGRRGSMGAGGRRVSGAARVCPGAQRSDIPHGCGHDEPHVCGRGISVPGQRGLPEWPGRRSAPPRERPQPPREPPDRPRFHFPEVPIDNILLNLEQMSGFHYSHGLRSIPIKTWQEPDFSRYLEEHGAGRVRIAPVRYRLLFLPLIPLIGPKDFLVKNLGGEVVRVQR